METEFTPINTQEEFETAVQPRLEEIRKQLETASETIATQAQMISDLTARCSSAEISLLKAKIAREYKIPPELADRLTGSTEDEIRKDAESFGKLVGRIATAPLASAEKSFGNSEQAALRSVLQNLNLNA